MTLEEITSKSTVRWSAKAVATEVNDEIILMNLGRDRCYGLGPSGSDIWRRMREPIAVAELLSQLESSYHAPPGEIEKDLLRTLRQFASEGLIQIGNSPD